MPPVPTVLESILNAFHDQLFVFRGDGVIEKYLTTNNSDEFNQYDSPIEGKRHRDILPPQVSEQLELAFKKIEGGVERYKFDFSLY